MVLQWNELDRILLLDIEGSDCVYNCCQLSSEVNPTVKPISPWTDAWQLYEDAYLVCADLWIGERGEVEKVRQKTWWPVRRL